MWPVGLQQSDAKLYGGTSMPTIDNALILSWLKHEVEHNFCTGEYLVRRRSLPWLNNRYPIVVASYCLSNGPIGSFATLQPFSPWKNTLSLLHFKWMPLQHIQTAKKTRELKILDQNNTHCKYENILSSLLWNPFINRFIFVYAFWHFLYKVEH